MNDALGVVPAVLGAHEPRWRGDGRPLHGRTPFAAGFPDRRSARSQNRRSARSQTEGLPVPRPKVCLIPAQGNALGSSSNLYCRPTACLIEPCAATPTRKRNVKGECRDPGCCPTRKKKIALGWYE